MLLGDCEGNTQMVVFQLAINLGLTLSASHFICDLSLFSLLLVLRTIRPDMPFHQLVLIIPVIPHI